MEMDEAIFILRSGKISEKRSAENLRKKFIDLIQGLKIRELAPEHLLILENELDNIFSKLEGSDEISTPKLAKAYHRLLRFVEREFSLIPDGYYGGLCMLWGVLIGALLLSLSIFYSESFYKFLLPLGGMSAGLLLGCFLDEKAERDGRTLMINKLKAKSLLEIE